jgi:di/tricarboxylate transporter
MNADALFVVGVIGVAGALMASNRLRYDIVALLVVVALMLSGVLTVGETLSGFGSPVVILVVCLLVVGEMLARTGVAATVGDWILRHGGQSESRLLVLVMLGAALLGAIMSSTAVVAIFIPIILRIANDTGLGASRLLLPMSYAALISGMLTLIATTPNIVIHEELKAEGYAGFGFFGFTAIGAVVLFAAVAYVLVLGRRLLPEGGSDPVTAGTRRQILNLWRDFNRTDEYCRARVEPGSALVGMAVGEAGLEDHYRVRLAGIEPATGSTNSVTSPSSSTPFSEGDIILLVGPEEAVRQLTREQTLTRLPQMDKVRRRWLWDIGGASVLIHPDSKLIGQTVKNAGFHTRYRLQVLGMRRGNEIIDDYSGTPLASGDSLFVLGPWSRIRDLTGQLHDFVVLELPSELADVLPERKKMPVAIGILVGMILLMLLEAVPVTAAALIAVIAAVLARCLTMEDAYRSIHWSSIVLIAGMLPLADALTATGGTQVIVDSLLDVAGDSGPYAMMTILFFLTAGLGLVLSNTASAVLVAPIAIYAAESLQVSPYPFAVAVLIAASAAYSTPVSTPVVTLVVDPGRYRFGDFLKLGLPLLLLTYLATLIVAPLVFPF